MNGLAILGGAISGPAAAVPLLAAQVREQGVVPAAVNVALGMLSVAMLLAFIRLVRGPSLADRVVALDLIGAIAVAVIAVYSISTAEPVILLPAIVVALIMFLGTVAFASYLERGSSP